ncbi:MAG: SRPBCC domain-containing protein [Flavobacteriales bacterium]|nr:SRPBCC domain-containing protein [Flavobacteriales bacterium]
MNDQELRTLTIQRTFNAPIELVFAAWTKPEHLVRWFGPNDFTLPTCEQDFRVGGKYNFCMHAPDGIDHWVRGEYRKISEFDRLVFTWTRDDGQPVPWVDNVVDLSFEEVNGRTKMTMQHALFSTEQDRNDHQGGWSECFDRLANFLHSASA